MKLPFFGEILTKQTRMFFKQFAIFCLVLGVVSLFVAQSISPFFIQVSVLAIGTILIMTGVGASIYDYLAYDRRQRQSLERYEAERQMRGSKRSTEGGPQSLPIATRLRELLNLAKATTEPERELCRKVVEVTLERELALYEAERRLASIQDNLEAVRFRIDGEIEALGRRGRVNLTIGGAFAVSGIVVLGILAMFTSVQNWDDLLREFLPRLTFVVFVEILSYFFLNLYRQGMFEIKYFQNELTTFESHCLALEGAVVLGNAALIGDVCKALSSTERNFILKKGETTVDMRLREIADKQISPTIGEVKKLIEVVSDVSRKMTLKETQRPT